ncbi:MAG TPA: transglutaminase family protein, partial [Pirellulales bacterium]|nr:transglutaminase family protein [Pirellulales bacterium]
PQGLKNSVVAGLISAVREVEGRPMIQLAIPIEPGNSGGPLVDVEGRVQGILTMKSLVTPNLGFAVAVNLLKPLAARPNPIPMTRWLTIGALDPRQWKPLFGARWRQRAGRITVEGAGKGFGGRSLCLYQGPAPAEQPLEIAVTLRMDDESGAAGLAFGADGENRHFGFYPSAGRLRLTRFDGPDVLSWTILHDQASPFYVSGGWNTLRVRLADGKIIAFVNDHQVVEMVDESAAKGQTGLVTFRETQAQFKGFRIGPDVAPSAVPVDQADRLVKLLESATGGPLDQQLIEALSAEAVPAAAVARERATMLDRQAARLRELADAAHAHRVIADLTAELMQSDDKIDLFRAGMLVARLDNEEIEVAAYCDELERLGRELAGRLKPDSDDAFKLELLRKYLFEENGFHGSRGDYYNRANSYLNEVLDDREGLPITLSVVYLELARRIGLPVVGLGLPGHFVVEHRRADGTPEIIDVYDAGRLLSHDETRRRLQESSDRQVSDEDFAPVSKRAIITRMLHNLLGVSGTDPKAMHRYLNAILSIEPASGQHRWLRAIVRYRLQERADALADIEWLLEHKPPGVEIARVHDLQQAIRQLPP